MKKKQGKKAWVLVLALIVVVCGSVLFVGAVSGWFNGPAMAEIDSEFYCSSKCYLELKDISVDEYNEMVDASKSFVVVVDQGGCTTADRIKEYAEKYSNKRFFQFFRIMYSEIKETNLKEAVKYYPSVAVISKGKVIVALRADSDEDAPIYNNYDDFENWMNKHIR
jgi:hypothetical protein